MFLKYGFLDSASGVAPGTPRLLTGELTSLGTLSGAGGSGIAIVGTGVGRIWLCVGVLY